MNRLNFQRLISTFFFLSIFYGCLLGQEAKADSLTKAEQYEAANALYAELLNGSSEPNDSLRIGLKIALNLQQLGAYKKAFNRLAADIPALQNRITADSLFGLAYHKMGVSQFKLGNLERAIEHYRRAVKIREDYHGKNHESVLKSYQNIAGCYYDLENYEKARQYYQLIIDRSSQIPNLSPAILTNTLLNQGSILALLNDFDVAVSYIQTGIKLTEKHFQEDFYKLDHAYNKAFYCYGIMEDGDQVIYYVNKRLDLYRDLNEEELYDEDYWAMADCYNNLGIGYEFKNDFDKAIKFYSKAIKLNSLYPKGRAKNVADNYNNLADLYRKIGQSQKAITSIEKAIEYKEKLDNPLELSLEYYNKGEIFFELGNYSKALEDYQKALVLYSFNFSPADILENPGRQTQFRGYKPLLIEILADKAKIFQAFAKKKNDLSLLKGSLATFDTATVFIDLIRNDFESDVSKTFLANDAKRIYENALEVCLSLFHKTKEVDYLENAFLYTERSKSLILLEAVLESNAKTIAGVPENLLKEEFHLKNEISELEEDLFTTNNDSLAMILQMEIIRKKNLQSQLVETLEAQHPIYHQLKYQIKLPAFSDFQKDLDNDQGILSFLVGKSKIHRFFIDNQTIKSDTINLNFPLKNWVQGFRSSIYGGYMDDPANQDSLDHQYTQIGYQLYEKLFRDLPELFPNCKRLKIIPDGVLGYLPFDALLTDSIRASEIGKYKDYPFLHHQYQLHYNYSVALSQEMDKAPKKEHNKSVLAFAPAFKRGLQSLRLGNTSVNLSPLFNNQKATQVIQGLLGGKLLVGPNASKSKFWQLASHYAYLHLASHAQINDENADFSFISFSQLGDQVSSEELLFVKELYNLDLGAEMVVLSACETGLGELKKGEGIISLARAFSYAGAKSIITSLWQVNDQRTGELMTRFYKHLKDGQSKDHALHLAKQEMITQGFNAHPYFWSSFIPIGSMRAVKLSHTPSWHYLFAGLLITIAFLLGGFGYAYRDW